jgi:hypothetical protein
LIKKYLWIIELNCIFKFSFYSGNFWSARIDCKMKYNRVIFFVIVLFLISYKSSSQNSRKYPLEQTYLSASQPYYISGNTLHYAVYLFDPETGSEEVPSSILFVEFLDPEGSLIFHHIHSMGRGKSPGTFMIPDTLQTGCYWLCAYTRYQLDFSENLIHYLPVFVIHPDDLSNPRILGEKLINKKNISQYAPEVVQNQVSSPVGPISVGNIRVEIREDKPNHTIREMVHLTVSIADKKGKPVKTGFSFLVRDLHQFHADVILPQSMEEYRTLKGTNFYYRVGEAKATYGIVSQTAPEETVQPKYPPQNELKLSGRYVDPDTGERLSFRAVSLTQTGQYPGFKLLFTDREGNFEFDDLNFTNRGNQLVLNAGINEGIIIENEWIHPAFNPPPVGGNLMQSIPFRKFLAMRRKELQYRKFYNLPQYMEEDSSKEDISRYRIYKKADRSYDLDDYIELTDMREVIIELLPNVKIFRENGLTRIKIFYHGNIDILPDPLFLVNGRIVKDNDYILNMDNRNIDKIEVLFKESSLEPFGPIGLGGVVAIYTKTPVKIPFGVPVDFTGYHEPQERIVGFNPREIGSKHFPDFNPLLYWDPDCTTDEEGQGIISFYTNDLASDFEVIVEGITSGGQPFYHVGHMSVNKPMNP